MVFEDPLHARGLGFERSTSYKHESYIPTNPLSVDGLVHADRTIDTTVWKTGWPMPAATVTTTSIGHAYARTHNGLRVAADLQSLPIVPVFPGFLIDALLFAAILTAVCYAPAIVRRLFHRPPDHCSSCGYDRRGLQTGVVCPECGAHSPNR